ncbi:hypothetical protein [Usitatibacter palustris]|uniref:Cyclic-di-GMP receptor FimW n=1 Tax=Usitatibacter palustris TaxID=2732487 RepID=A0A6M4HBD7_9PROT|nr:hypothetical protein [Usitatibacter palustris]QJR16891.1 Cyclic-di-GMP receptor FimW [Usitatibacter palustris]
MATQPPNSRPTGSIPFGDARACKEWLNALPLTNIPQAQSLVLDALKVLNRADDFEAIERLKCIELMRDKISFLQGEQRSRYFGKTMPLSPNDSAAWGTGRALLEEMENGYRKCLEQAMNESGEISRHVALVTQRIVRYLGTQMLFHAVAYRRFDPAVWLRLHQLYAEAERRGVAEERVKDSLEGEEGVSSVAEAYSHVVMMQAAYLSEMTAPQMDFAEALLRLWIRKVRLLKEPPPPAEGTTAWPLAVDLTKPIGARPLSHGAQQASHRVFDVEQISKSIRRRVRALQNDEEPASLGLPAEASALDALHQMQRLHKLWCEGAPPRPPAKVPNETTAGLTFGVNEIHFFLSSGKIFEQPDKTRELTRQEKNDIAMFGRVRESTQSMMSSEFNFTVENWGVVDEMLGAWRLLRPATASKGVAIGRLVAMRLGDGAPFFLGMVSALVQETDGRIVITVTLFPGRPEPIAVRAGDARNRQTAQWVQGFRLPAIPKLNIPESLVVPGGMALRGRGIEIWIEEAAKEATVYDVLEHGTDFDRFTF